MKFKVGDRVKSSKVGDNRVGFIMEINPALALPYLVVFPGWGEGHDGNGLNTIELAPLYTSSARWCDDEELISTGLTIDSEQLAAADIPTPEAEDNTADIAAAELPKGRLMKAYEKYEAAIRQEEEAYEEIEQILKEMRKR